MDKIVKYNLEIMSGIFVVFIVIGILNWSELSMIRQMVIIYMGLYTLHEWEESRFPGGFYKIFFSKCSVDPNMDEGKMHFPVSIYLLIILIVPFAFENIVIFVLVPLVLALFEGFIHTAGIILHQLKKPYSPGMITAWTMFIYSIVMILRLNTQLNMGAIKWILGIVLTAGSFTIMESQFMKGAGVTVGEFQTSMKNHMLSRIRGMKGDESK